MEFQNLPKTHKGAMGAEYGNPACFHPSAMCWSCTTDARDAAGTSYLRVGNSPADKMAIGGGLMVIVGGGERPSFLLVLYTHTPPLPPKCSTANLLVLLSHPCVLCRCWCCHVVGVEAGPVELSAQSRFESELNTGIASSVTSPALPHPRLLTRTHYGSSSSNSTHHHPLAPHSSHNKARGIWRRFCPRGVGHCRRWHSKLLCSICNGRPSCSRAHVP